MQVRQRERKQADDLSTDLSPDDSTARRGAFRIDWRRRPRLPGALGCAIALIWIGPLCHAQGAVTAGNTDQAKAAAARLLDLQEAFTGLADRLEPAVVTVFSLKSDRRSAGDSDPRSGPPRGMFGPGSSRRATGTGSGVIISPDGWVLTNDHVAGGADKVTIRLHDGREFTGKVRRDSRSDLALVKIEAPAPLPYAALGDSNNVKIGQWAIAIGSPFRYEGSFSVGVISSLFRSQRIPDFSLPGGLRLYPNMLQTDAAINPGNSGGPLCNIAGEVIGINTAIESEGGGSVGIGFAIPINTAKFVIAQLKEKGRVEYGYLGVSPITVTPRIAGALNVEAGALLDTEPQQDSPAGKAGLHAGDVVIGINGKKIANELDLRTTVAQTPPGATIELAVMRDGKPQTLKATLTPAADLSDNEQPVPPKPRLGIDVQPLPKKAADETPFAANVNGVVVKYVDPDTAAADQDSITKGDIILRVNNKETPTVEAFMAAIADLKSGDQIKILYLDHTARYNKRFAIVPID
jgi:serine protease Do